jgi:hypothetical protein
MPVWRKSEDDRPISLMITRAGRDAIGVEETALAEVPHSSNKQSEEGNASITDDRSRDRRGAKKSIDDRAGSPRAGTKQALVIEMLCAKGGVTLDALVAATGWLPHTTRAALTGLRKRGFAIERTREEGSDSIYRIVSAPAAAAV